MFQELVSWLHPNLGGFKVRMRRRRVVTLEPISIKLGKLWKGVKHSPKFRVIFQRHWKFMTLHIITKPYVFLEPLATEKRESTVQDPFIVTVGRRRQEELTRVPYSVETLEGLETYPTNLHVGWVTLLKIPKKNGNRNHWGFKLKVFKYRWINVERFTSWRKRQLDSQTHTRVDLFTQKVHLTLLNGPWQ